MAETEVQELATQTLRLEQPAMLLVKIAFEIETRIFGQAAGIVMPVQMTV